MSSLPFLTEIRGQDHAVSMIRRAAAARRMAHAYLFRGPRGVGKRSAATAFARFLLCREPKPDDACGRCVSCRKMASGNHPDIQFIEPNGAAIKIEQIRELQRSLAFPPLEGVLRVSIIIRAQTMAAPAANALLKTLEEPPPGNLLIITAEDSAPILPTIISRCQLLGFNNLEHSEVREILARKAQFESDSTALARLAAGSPGLAMKLAESEIPELQEKTAALLARALHNQPAINDLLALAKDCAALKDDLPIFLEGVYTWLTDLAWHVLGQPQRGFAAKLNDAEKEIAAAMKIDGINRRLGHIRSARSQLARNCNRQAVCELLFLRLAARAPGP